MDTLKEPKGVKARKKYRCDFCDKILEIGEEHTVVTYKEDYIYDFRSCDRCKTYVDEALNNKDYDWGDGMNNADFREYMWQEHRDIAEKWWE